MAMVMVAAHPISVAVIAPRAVDRYPNADARGAGIVMSAGIAIVARAAGQGYVEAVRARVAAVVGAGVPIVAFRVGCARRRAVIGTGARGDATGASLAE